MPWNVFDGKLFHQKYLQSEKGYAVEALLEQNVSSGFLFIHFVLLCTFQKQFGQHLSHI